MELEARLAVVTAERDAEIAMRRRVFVLLNDYSKEIERTASSVTYRINPSTADADSDDPTIRRCRAFAASSNCGRLVVVNLFAFRATKPSELKRAADPIGPHNDLYLTNAARRASIIVCAWGIHGGFLGRDKAVRTLVSAIGRYFHLGLTRDGHPRHPLYVPSATAPILWMNAK